MEGCRGGKEFEQEKRKMCLHPYLQHKALPWDVHALLNSVEEVSSISVASASHEHVHCKFQGSYNKNSKAH